MADFNGDHRPRLAAGVHLHFDADRQAWVLQTADCLIATAGPVHEVVRRCDGTHTVTQIVDELAGQFSAPRPQIASDVDDLLAQLADNGLITR